MSCCLFLVTDRELVVTDRELLVTDRGLVVLLSTDNGKFGRFCFNPTRIHNRVAEPSTKWLLTSDVVVKRNEWAFHWYLTWYDQVTNNRDIGDSQQISKLFFRGLVRQWWYPYWSRCKLLLLIIRWKLVVPQIGFNYSLVGMRKIDSTLKFNEPSESLVNLHSLIVCSSLCVSSKLTPNLLWLVWTFTASEPDISSRTLS